MRAAQAACYPWAALGGSCGRGGLLDCAGLIRRRGDGGFLDLECLCRHMVERDQGRAPPGRCSLVKLDRQSCLQLEGGWRR